MAKSDKNTLCLHLIEVSKEKLLPKRCYNLDIRMRMSVLYLLVLIYNFWVKNLNVEVIQGNI